MVKFLPDNFFIPCFKLKEKIKDEREKAVKKVYEEPKTPYQRLMEGGYLEERKREELRRIYEGLDLVELREKVERSLDELMALKDKGMERKG